jgi:hypothetical protein
MDIRCRKTNCRYNDKLTCRAHNINIGQKLICRDYQYMETKGKDFSKKIFEGNEPPSIAPYRHNKNLMLTCSAKCLFNKEGKCIANGITINDSGKIAKCISFAKP